MKAALRFGILAALFVVGLAVFTPGDGGIRDPMRALAAPGNNLTVRVSDAGSTADHQFAVTRPAPCLAANIGLSNGEFATYNCPAAGDWTITVTPAAGRNFTGANCTISDFDETTVGQQSATLSLVGNVLTLSIIDNEDFDCTFSFAAAATPGSDLIVRVSDAGTAVDHQFAIQRPNPCGLANTALSGGEFATFSCATAGQWTVTVTPAAGRTFNGANCTVSSAGTTSGQQSSIVSLVGTVLTLSVLDDEDFDCTFSFSDTPRTLQLSASPAEIACGGSSQLTAVVIEANAPVPGLTFEFTTTVGTITPATSTDGIATLTLLAGDADATVTVAAAGLTQEIVIENDCAPLSIFAAPPYLPCGGGTTHLTAVLRDTQGNVVPNAIYEWSISSGSGAALDVGAPNSPAAIDGNAVLFLPSSTTSATVTVQAGGESESVVITQVCAPIAIAITADPNVIPCGGTANLTATARDRNGHIVNDLGFHWETNMGQLYVGPPNTADAVDNRATLTLVPGMTNAVVKAWVGSLSENPGEVTIQQFCPGVTTDGSSATGTIQLSASSATAGCGEAIFIGARVRDSKNQVPAGDTPVRFLASAGAFQVDAGVTTTYSGQEASQGLVTVSQYNTATDANGVLNLTYLAPTYRADAVITAASGDKFAKLTIKVDCATPPPATVSGTSGSSPAPCTPIGDGVCIRPPSTGLRITPPSTGDAGLK